MKINLDTVAELTGGKIIKGDPTLEISGVASLLDATSTEASFLGNEKYFQDFLNTKSGLVLVPPNLPQYPDNVAFVEVENPSMAFNALVKHFHTAVQRFTPGIHPTAYIDPTSKIDPTQVQIGPHVFIGANVEIGNGTQIDANTTIYDGAKIGSHCRIYSHVSVRERCEIGNRVTLQNGCVIGGDGFGFLMGEDGRYIGIDQVGIVEIQDDVSIGCNAAVDRARFGRTIIGEGSKLDNLVQIGHNCVIGKHCIIVAQSGIAGSTVIEDYCTIAAQVGIAGHLRVGKKAIIGAKSGVISSLEGDKAYLGMPCSPHRDACREYAAIKKLPQILKEFNTLKKTFLKDD